MEMKAKPKKKPKTHRVPKFKIMRSLVKKWDDMVAVVTAIGMVINGDLERREKEINALEKAAENREKAAEACSDLLDTSIRRHPLGRLWN